MKLPKHIRDDMEKNPKKYEKMARNILIKHGWIKAKKLINGQYEEVWLSPDAKLKDKKDVIILQ